MAIKNQIPKIGLSILKLSALVWVLVLCGYTFLRLVPLAYGDPPGLAATEPFESAGPLEEGLGKQSLLFRLPPGRYRGADGGPIIVKTKASPLSDITGALAAAFSPDPSLATEKALDYSQTRDSLKEVHVMVPDTMSEREIDSFLAEINREFSVQGLHRIDLVPVLVPVRGAIQASQAAMNELETAVENQPDEAKVNQALAELRSLSSKLKERLSKLKAWAGQVKNWREKSMLEKRNFVLVGVGLGRGLIGGAVLYLDASSDPTNLLRMAFVFAIDVYFVVGHRHYASLAKRFNPKLFGKKIEVWFKESPRVKTFVFNYFVSIGIQLVNSLGGYIAKGGAEAGLSDPLDSEALTELAMRTGRNSILKAPALLAFEVLRNKGYISGWREDVVNLFIQTLAQSEGLAYGTGKLDLWRSINFTRSLTFLFMIVLGRILPPLKTIPIILSSQLTERQIRDIEFTHGVYKATEISGATKKESTEIFARLATEPGPVGRMAKKVESGVAWVFEKTQGAAKELSPAPGAPRCVDLLFGGS